MSGIDNITSWYMLHIMQTQADINNEMRFINTRLQTNYLTETYGYPKVCCTSGPEKTNCCNCGASLKGKYRCEYCETINL